MTRINDKDTLDKNILHKDTLHKGILHKDILHKDTLHKGILREDTLHKGTLSADLLTFMITSRSIPMMRKVSGKICRENQNSFSVQQRLSDSRVVYDIIWKKLVEQEGHRGKYGEYVLGAG
jgi:hypothetical protein